MNYYEVWSPAKDHDSYRLNKAYLHLDLANREGSDDQEVMALHTDLCLAPNEPAYKYKRGPHLHFSKLNGELSKSHVALCLTDIEKVCNSLEEFTLALKVAIEMIDDEFLPRI